MTNKDDRQHDWYGVESHELDHELDAALAKYAAVEPRAGLEERVLANLRTAPAEAPGHAWWRWGAMAAFAAVLLVAIALAWRSGKPSHPEVARHPFPAPQVVSNGHQNGVHPHVSHPRRTAAHHAQLLVVAAAPRLDQFPSPLPLSEQERILASYVATYPEHAVLVARARAEALLLDQEEERREADHDRNSQQTNK